MDPPVVAWDDTVIPFDSTLRHINDIKTFILGIAVAPMARLKRRKTGRSQKTYMVVSVTNPRAASWIHDETD